MISIDMARILNRIGAYVFIAYLVLCAVVYMHDLTWHSFGYIEVVCGTALIGLMMYLITTFSDRLRRGGRTGGGVLMTILFVVAIAFFYLTLQPLITITVYTDTGQIEQRYAYGYVDINGRHVSWTDGRYVVVNDSRDTMVLRQRKYRCYSYSSRKRHIDGYAINADDEKKPGPDNDQIIAIISPRAAYSFSDKVYNVYGRPDARVHIRSTQVIVKDYCFNINYLDRLCNDK